MLYTEKTPAQALTAINTRMQAKESSARNSLGGWVEKSGAFSLSVSTPVIGRIQRRTVMHGKIERDNAVTIVRGDVPSGVDRQGQLIVFIALALLGVLILTSGNAIALVLIPLGAYLYIPMTGDRANSDILLTELQRTLKARQTPPKKSSEAKDAARSTGTTRAVSATRSTGTSRAAGTTTRKSTSTSTGTTRKPAGRSTGTTRKSTTSAMTSKTSK